VTSVNGDFDAGLKRPARTRWVLDHATSIDLWCFLSEPRTEDKSGKKGHSNHSEKLDWL
jgi:hypothetical protein